MTTVLDTPAPDLVVIEEEQHDSPLMCTSLVRDWTGKIVDGPCDRQARWETLCMGCGHVFRRCEEHYRRNIELSTRLCWGLPDGAAFRCHRCKTAPVFPDQFVRI